MGWYERVEELESELIESYTEIGKLKKLAQELLDELENSRLDQIVICDASELELRAKQILEEL